MTSTPTVTRSTVWLTASDQPYIDLEIKGFQFFVPFDKTLRFYRPTATRAIYPDGEKQAKEDGMDLRVPRTTWWIETDYNLETACQLSCSWSACFGFQVKYHNSRTDTQISFKVNQKESRDIFNAIERMMLELAAAAPLVTEDVVILRPYHSYIMYRAKALLYKRPIGPFTERLAYMSPYRAQVTAPPKGKKK